MRLDQIRMCVKFQLPVYYQTCEGRVHVRPDGTFYVQLNNGMVAPLEMDGAINGRELDYSPDRMDLLAVISYDGQRQFGGFVNPGSMSRIMMFHGPDGQAFWVLMMPGMGKGTPTVEHAVETTVDYLERLFATRSAVYADWPWAAKLAVVI